jgi:hypothetical protein
MFSYFDKTFFKFFFGFITIIALSFVATALILEKSNSSQQALPLVESK